MMGFSDCSWLKNESGLGPVPFIYAPCHRFSRRPANPTWLLSNASSASVLLGSSARGVLLERFREGILQSGWISFGSWAKFLEKVNEAPRVHGFAETLDCTLPERQRLHIALLVVREHHHRSLAMVAVQSIEEHHTVHFRVQICDDKFETLDASQELPNRLVRRARDGHGQAQVTGRVSDCPR